LGFVNEHFLAVLFGSGRGDPPRLQIIDTEQGTTMKPIQTSFFFSTAYLEAPYPRLLIEPCGHVPSPDELMTAPFYPDCSQRILAFYFGMYGTCHTINADLLLELAREQEGQDVGWDEWGAHTIEVDSEALGILDQICVSGCRIFCTMSNNTDNVDGDSTYLRMYDFSHGGRAKHLHTLDEEREGRGKRRLSPSLDGYKLPWNLVGPWTTGLIAGHDSFVFRVVSILIFLFAVY
jgi:hypothetical protein